MKKGIRTEIDWKLIGAELACCDDVEQADFFRYFIKEINSFGTRHQGQGQLAFINNKLTKKEREDLSMITFIDPQEV